MRKRVIAGGLAVEGDVGEVVMAAPLAVDPDGPKDCGGPDLQNGLKTDAAAQVAEPNWSQKFGTINDESCLNRTAVRGIVAPKTYGDVAGALAWARAKSLPVTAAGVKHSMGGQAFTKGGVVLDMTGMNGIKLDPVGMTVTVGSGARWHDIQNAIHPRFAIKAMQSTDVFTVGGSISVNAHGMDHRAGALMGSIRDLKMMMADGSIVTASRTENADLFAHAVGGYGLFGVILEATLGVVPNDVYASGRDVIATADFPKTFAALEADPNVALTYTHLSTAPGSLLKEALVYRYAKVEDPIGERPPLGEVGAVKLRRVLVNLSKHGNPLRSLKWWSEKNLEHRFEACTITRAQAMANGEACLVSRNDPMHDSVPYLYNNLKSETDILHEYFVPRERILPFVEAMRGVFTRRNTNLINASIRAVEKEENALSYAPERAFSVVLYINQKATPAGDAEMKALTSELIDLTHAHGGRFFLPYQLHYSPEQLKASYPEIGAFFESKKRWDPDGLFRNSWYDRYASAVTS